MIVKDVERLRPFAARYVWWKTAEEALRYPQRVVDFLPVLRGELYGPLRDLALFNQVALDTEVHTLVWPNGADFDPATLHEWPRCGAAFAEMTRAWGSVTA